MSEITDAMINDTLAAFTGITRGYKENGHYHANYHESLDALIPVVERLGLISFEFNSDWVESGRQWISTIEIPDPNDDNNVLVCNVSNKSPARALALACYYVIKEIKDGI